MSFAKIAFLRLFGFALVLVLGTSPTCRSQTSDYDGTPYSGNKSELVTVHLDMNLGLVFVTNAFLFDEGKIVLPNTTPKGKNIPRCLQPAEYCVIDHTGLVIKYPLSKGHVMLGNEVATWSQWMNGTATWMRYPGKLRLVLYMDVHMGSPVNSGSVKSEEIDVQAGTEQFFNAAWARTQTGTTIELKRWRVRLLRNSRPAAATDSLVRIVELGDVNALHERISKGSDPNASDPDAISGITGWTPLIAAAESGQAEIVKILLDARVPVNQRSSVGDTPLIEAASDGHADIVRILLDANASVGATLNDGATALHLAAQNGHADVVKMLIDAKADVNVRNQNRLTPLAVAERNHHADIVQLLKSAGAKK